MTKRLERELEPTWYLRCLPYSAYRQTEHWRRVRNAYTNYMEQMCGGKMCQLCWRHGIDEVEYLYYHIHHVTYENLGNEQLEDLRMLCAPCHNLVHFPDSNAAQAWVAFWAQREDNAEPAIVERARSLDPHVREEMS